MLSALLRRSPVADPVVTFLWHLLRASLVVCVTYNPSGWSYLSWVGNSPTAPASLVLLCGLCLASGLIHLVRLARGSFGPASLITAFLISITALWTISDVGLLPSSASISWVMLFAIINTLAIGASLPEWRRQKRLRWHQRRGSNAGGWLEGDFD